MLSVAVALLTPVAPAAINQANLELSGGRWWDGEKFVPKTFYSVSRLLTAVRPNHVDSVFDLTGKFVVPPYADAHVHNLADP